MHFLDLDSDRDYSATTIIVSSYLDCRYEDNRAKVRVIGIRKCEYQNETMYGKLTADKQEIDLILKPKQIRECPWLYGKGMNFQNSFTSVTKLCVLDWNVK